MNARPMKRPTVASLKKVTPENLAMLGADRLAEILAEVAEGRADLKRRLRMELAAEHLLAEIDKRLGLLRSSRSKVSWRQRPAFVRDLDAQPNQVASRAFGCTGGDQPDVGFPGPGDGCRAVDA